MSGGTTPAPPTTGQRRWRFVKRWGTIAFLLLVAGLIVHQARAIEWREVGAAMQQLPAASLALGALIAAASYALFSCFDLIGRHVVGHRLGARAVMTVNFVSYAFNLNFGAPVGSVGLRYRLYSRLGLGTADITRVLTLSLITNWLGYLMIGGLALVFFPLEPPPEWKLDAGALRLLGGAMIAGAAVWLSLCLFSKRREWQLRGHDVALPSPRIAGLQLVMGMTNWALIGAIIWLLLLQKVPYVTVLSVLLVAAVAGLISHVPAGLGVLEAVFVALLGQQIGHGVLIGGLLAYRCLYYLAPLAVATVVYFIVEARARRIAAAARAPADRTAAPSRA